jgi:hypothetical protein
MKRIEFPAEAAVSVVLKARQTCRIEDNRDRSDNRDRIIGTDLFHGLEIK